MSAPLRIAVVGAGPAGCYVVDALCADRERDLLVDLFDRLPTPFGLLRYGVAPDHLKMKRVQVPLEKLRWAMQNWALSTGTPPEIRCGPAADPYCV